MVNDVWKNIFNLAATTFDIILASTFSRDIGRQFSKSDRSFPFFLIKVTIACFWDSDISPFFRTFICTFSERFTNNRPKFSVKFDRNSIVSSGFVILKTI